MSRIDKFARTERQNDQARPTATVPTGDYAYALTLLPTAAPSLGPYATPLPILFTRQPASVAGKYTVQTSATGYATKSSLSPVDISGGDATSQDFALTP